MNTVNSRQKKLKQNTAIKQEGDNGSREALTVNICKSQQRPD